MFNPGFDTPTDWAMNQAQAPEDLVNDLDQYIMASLLTELNELRQNKKLKDDGTNTTQPDISAKDEAPQDEEEEYFESIPPVECTPVSEFRSVSVWEQIFWLFVLWFVAWPLAAITSPLFVAWQPVPVFFGCAYTPMKLLTRIATFPTRCAENITGRRRIEQ